MRKDNSTVIMIAVFVIFAVLAACIEIAIIKSDLPIWLKWALLK